MDENEDTLGVRGLTRHANSGGSAHRSAPAAPARAAKREFASLGDFIHSVRFEPKDSRLAGLHREPGTTDGVRSEMRTDDGASGGFAVPVQFRDELMQVSQTPGLVRPLARVLPAGSPPDGELVIPVLKQSFDTNLYGGIEVHWIAEGGAKPDASAVLKQVTLRPQEVAASVKISDKTLRNWPACGSVIGSLLRGAISAAEDSAFISGNGVAKPLGFLNSSAAIAVNRTTAGAMTYADVLTMDETFFDNGGDDSSVVWVCSKRTRTQLRLLKNQAGFYVWQEDARQSGPATLFGRRVMISDRCPTLGFPGDLSLVDLSTYLIKDGSGPVVAASPHVNFLTNETLIKIWWNVDGQPWISDAVKNEAGEMQSPIVILH